MSEEFSVRRFEPADQAEVKRLYRETVQANPELYYRPLSGPQLPDDIANNFAHPSDSFYVATCGGKIIGFCGLRTLPEDRTAASLANGTVVPEFQGRGVYRALYTIRMAEAVENGIKTLLAITSQQNNKMKEFFSRDGFEEYTPEQPVPGFCHLRKRLR